MKPLHFYWRELLLAVAVCLSCQLLVLAADEQTLTKEQIKQFLLTAKVVNTHQSKKGITQPSRLTLFVEGEDAGAGA